MPSWVYQNICGFRDAVAMVALLASVSVARGGPADYPAASLTPRSQVVAGPGLASDLLDPTAPPDEAQGGMTEVGTPISPRVEACFPAEQRNVFNDVDSVLDADGRPVPFDYAEGSGVSPHARNAIRGKNTWILWGEGNEVFWDWVTQHGYGLADFLVLLDSRKHDTRFADSGLISQPGMKAQTDPAQRILGLFLDEADGDRIRLTQPADDVDIGASTPVVRPELPPDHAGRELFEPGDRELYDETLAKLPDDGLDPTVYGYPSGIVGLRLLPNPNFFGNTEAAATARERWNERVVENPERGAYYSDPAIHADPKLVRPFRVSMSCGFCHISPSPINPPADPDKMDWANMSSTIGNQYWTPAATFTNLRKPDSFLYQFLASQQPGTIDTSLVSTDHINNSNTITAIFDVPARLDRAGKNPPEDQSVANLLIPQIEDPEPDANPRHTPRVLLDGADSVGVFGALSRVYLNIGAYSEEWKRLHNTVVGFRPQRPFSVATALKNSVYWRTADEYRIPYLADFFTYESATSSEGVTQPMHLGDTTVGRPIVEAERAEAAAGRAVFVENCAVCHSSKQPEGFNLRFSREWADKTLDAGAPPALTLPMDQADWTKFAASAPYREYVWQISQLAGSASGAADPFLKDNFLSTDIRVPITLVGTNSGRAVATNAMRGQVWDNFSSETYKSLPAVGEVPFFNPFSGKPVDPWGNNDAYAPPGGGPGYYRPASLISLWATAPFLHNNTLGEYTHDPSIEGRLAAYDDGIDKLLWPEQREAIAARRPGDLRGEASGPADGDAGFIYRTTEPSWIDFPAPFIKPLITGLVGERWTSFLTTWLWVGLAVAAALLAVFGQTRHAGFVFALVAVVTGILLRMSGIGGIYPVLWLVPVAAAIVAGVFWFAVRGALPGRVTFAVLALVAVFAGVQVHRFVDGKSGDLLVGPVPAGTPVNLVMNLNPEAPVGDLLGAVFGLTRGILRVRKDSLEGEAAWEAFEAEAAEPLMRASKCPDFVLDRGHWFAAALTDEQKTALKAFLKTL